ncbi:MAG: nitroreductase family protein [Candidatus Sigynarchaeota archaeon]
MEFTRPVLDVIKARTSWRSYSSVAIATDVKQFLLSMISKKTTSPFGASCKLQWITMEGIDPAEKKKLGTYGVITGAREFIVGITPEGDMNALQHLGYVLERVVLHATDAGLATCWLGGTFNRLGVAELVKAGAGDSIPAMIPVGYATNHRHIVDVVVRFTVKAKSRKPFESICFDGDFGKPLGRSQAGSIESALEAVRLGPSSKNVQPWRIIVARDGAAVHFYNVGGWHLDRGIAVCHFDLQAKEQGLDGTWRVENPGIVAPDGVDYVISWFKK